MKTIKDIPNLEGVKVLVRVDFNVPIQDGAVMDDFRVRTAIPTVTYLLDRGAKVMLISHLESIDGGKPSLQPVCERLNKLGIRAIFVKDLKKAYETVENSSEKCFVLENLRFFDGEKKNDQVFAQQLASLADIYVNDAFSVCHREHASMVSIPRFLPSYAGLEIEDEVKNLSKAFDPAHPFLFILGGAKFLTKLPLIDRFIDIADNIFVGGALANDLFRAKGFDIGQSSVSDTSVDLSKIIKNPKVSLPMDVLNQNREVKKPIDMSPSDKILDVGPETMKYLKAEIERAQFILWNGPMGHYEDGYVEATHQLAQYIAKASREHAVTSIVGGGDTLATIAKLGVEKDMTFVSAAGGAMLEFLAKGTLPGIEALKNFKE